MEEIAAAHPEHFIKVSAAWVTSVLEKRDANNVRDFSQAHTVLQQMKAGGRPGTDHDFMYFRELIRDHVTQRFSYGEKQNYRMENFPGPMASQMGKKDVRQLRDNAYWITEKSDGIRLMFLGMRSPKFPRWCRVVETSPNFLPLSLLESAAIEDAMVKKASNAEVTVDGVACRLDLETETAIPQGDSSRHAPIKLKRKLGFSFGYVFDRTFELYLCLDEFCIPFGDTLAEELEAGRPLFELTHACFALMDGEYLRSHADGRINYSIYDIVSVSHVTPTMNTEHLNFYDKPMSERLVAIRRYIVDPHHKYHSHFGLPPPTSMRFVAKHFYTKAELPVVISSIHKDSSGEYIYEDEQFGRNLNDGLVFTPEDPKLYAFKPGGAKNLLKWKWPDKLSVDFKVEPKDLTKTPMEFDFFFTARRGPNQTDVLYKHGPLLNSRRLEIPLDRPSICECIFLEQLGIWDVLLVRTDKTFGNGFPAVSSTLENIVTNLSIDDLAAELMRDPRAGTSQTNVPAEEVHFKVDKGRDNRLCLQYFLQFPPYRAGNPPFTIWQSYVPVSECFGFQFDEFVDEHGNVPLVEHLSANMGTAGGLYVIARFHVNRGRWEIFSGVGRQEECSGQKLLLTLERMAHNGALAKQQAAVAAMMQNGMSGAVPSAPAPSKSVAPRAPAGPSCDTEAPAKRRKLPTRNRQQINFVPVIPPEEVANTPDPTLEEHKQAVAEHYDKVTEQAQQEDDGDRSSLRRYNNWVKTVLVAETVVGGVDVLDLCCGRGGDLVKWKKAGVRSVVGADISSVAIKEATRRWEESFKDNFQGNFVCCDCFGPTLNRAIAGVRPEKGFAVVSSQFAIHYAFRTEAHVMQLLYNISSNLKSGGVFIGTTVDDKEFVKRLQEGTVNEAGNREFGNTCYKVELLPGYATPEGGLDPSHIYGIEYNFTLHGSVENCAEYLIRWDNFVHLARRFDLVLDYEKEHCTNFSDFYDHYSKVRPHDRLYQNMCSGGLSPEEWEVATVYRTFVFKKR